MASQALHIEVALPVPFRHTFTYAVPNEWRARVAFGVRVLVPFRKQRLVGIVTALEAKSTEVAAFEIRSVAEVLDGGSVVASELYSLCAWLADYYFAPIGEVLRAACPLAFTSSIRQQVMLTPKGNQRLQESQAPTSSASLFRSAEEESNELQVLSAIAREGQMELRALRKKFRGISWKEALAGLQSAGEIVIQSEVERNPVIEKQETFLRLAPGVQLKNFNQRLSPGQRKILEFLSARTDSAASKELISSLNVSAAVVKGLIRRRLVEVEKVRRDRVPLERMLRGAEETAKAAGLELTADQKRALRIIDEAIDHKRFTTILLHGVTASGKTEIYLRAIERVVAEGGTALLLVPEIALTPAAARAFVTRFAGCVAILHSALSEGERYDEWWRIKRGEARVVIGTRSAVFAPLENLRLIAVDEEHDGSYKQQESPRYQARDVSIVRGKMTGAVVLLGSATPSMESFHNAQRGKYQLIALKNRVESRSLARVAVVDMRREFKETRKSEFLSRDLIAAIESRLVAEEQILVLLNRRGFSSFVLCRSCGATRQCPNCSITMTYHKRREILLCHYCAAVAPVPNECWQCQSEHLYFVGGGTEQIEEKLRHAFPPARIARLDRDTAQGRGRYHHILGEFSEGTTDILVGTQMIAKGHDFPRVTLVGVLNADGALRFPDFRSAERTFQLLTQVAGRAGRGETPGEVILQAFVPEHYAIRFAAKQSFIDFYNQEIHFRRMMHYPPFAQLALVGLRHQQYDDARQIATSVGDYLRAHSLPEVRILGPAIAPLARVKKEYRWQLLLKSSRRPALRRMIERCLEFCESKKIAEPNVLIDVDPTNMM
jgi:primosomal protein N' (replication factor Y)